MPVGKMFANIYAVFKSSCSLTIATKITASSVPGICVVVSLIVSLRKIDKIIRTIRNQATICRIAPWSSGVTLACLGPSETMWRS